MNIDRSLWELRQWIGGGDYMMYLRAGHFVDGYWFRYGRPIPSVAVVGYKLLVSDSVAQRLRGFGLRFNPVKDVVVTNPDVDWLGWSVDAVHEHLWRFGGHMGVNGPDDYAMPFEAVDAAGDIRREAFVGRTWCRLGASVKFFQVIPGGGLAQTRDMSGMPVVLVSREIIEAMSGGVYQVPWGLPGRCCVSAVARAILEGYAWDRMLDFKLMDVRVI